VKPGPDIRQMAKVLAASRQEARHNAFTAAAAATNIIPQSRHARNLASFTLTSANRF